MTRVLSELLDAPRVAFHHNIAYLESASGHGNTDIRLTSEVSQAVKLKIKELGLDPKDTTGEELYTALLTRVKGDDQRLAETLRAKYGGDITMTESVSKVLCSIEMPKECFAIKNTVARSLLKKHLPKRTMKTLGYRSYDSMMKHEAVAAVLAAALLLETVAWKKSLMISYKKLQSKDFEIRDISVDAPNTKHWQDLAATIVTDKKHNIVVLKELGSIVLLPMPDEKPDGVLLIMMLLSLRGMNEIRASSAYLKLCQVKPDFGSLVQSVAMDEPFVAAKLLDRPVPWQIIQRYYARFSTRFKFELFEPHVQIEDLSWHSIEKTITKIDPRLEFWHQTSHLSFLNNGQAVSLNIIDVATNYCNKIPYANRIVRYFRRELWQELILRYMQHENVEQTVMADLESDLVQEPDLL